MPLRAEQQSWLPSLSMPQQASAAVTGTLPRSAALLASAGLRSKDPASQLYSTATLTSPDDYRLPAFGSTQHQVGGAARGGAVWPRGALRAAAAWRCMAACGVGLPAASDRQG
jgi:hypothetical protein